MPQRTGQGAAGRAWRWAWRWRVCGEREQETCLLHGNEKTHHEIAFHPENRRRAEGDGVAVAVELNGGRRGKADAG